MAAKKDTAFPDRDDILAYIKDNPGRISKRDIARAFHIRGDKRIDLKKLLRGMTEDGLLEKGDKGHIHLSGALPAVCVVEICGIDRMGDLSARPVNWKGEATPPPITIFSDDKRGGKVGQHDQLLVRLSQNHDSREISYIARIIRKLERSSPLVMGIFHIEDDSTALVQPTDKKNRSQYLVVRGDWNGAEDGELVIIETKGGKTSRRQTAPKKAVTAKVKERLEAFDKPGSISLIAIHAHGILTGFSEQTLQEAEKSAAPVPKGRTDLRDIPLITVDPADARDHDDAIWAEPDPDPANEGGWHIIVAIADVAHYVTPGSSLEKEARERGNSTYFPDRVVPMLPESLSNGLCSLKEGEDRYSLAVHIWFDERGKKIRHKFVRGLMRSAAGLSYGEFQAARDGTVSDRAGPLLKTVIEPLFAAYDCLKKGRDYREPLSLVMPERKIELDDDGNVMAIRPVKPLDAHKLVEEFMIQANVAAAEELERKGWPCIFRIHDQPSAEKLNNLREFLASLGYSFAKGMVQRPKLFNNILRKVEDSPHADVVNIIILRTQSQAIYSVENHGHFGLSLSRYAHFTSPIRRYADLMVHRALIGALKLGQDGLAKADRESLVDTADHISKTERISMIAERESTDRYVAAYMNRHVGEEFSARISGVSRAGLFVTFDNTGGDGFIPVSSMAGDYFRHDRDLHMLEGEYTGTVYKLGDSLSVRLKEANRMTGGLLCELVDNVAPAGRRKGRARSGKGRPKHKRR